ncbi:MAG: acyltransferase [Cytophagaceae bacterium]|jgi:peptidoglycan/LPS O-acetylase OafA/YrhL|nr:acyltransferase [Cytophagaceae bacterium]
MLPLRRITTSQSYLPFIDGLRFIAIVPVLLNHFITAYDKKFHSTSFSKFYEDDHIELLAGNSNNSVLLFFAISGFILGLPFAKHYFNTGEKPLLKDYYIKRVSRLEPPYLIVLTGILLLHVFILHKSSLAAVLPHYLASFFYLHNIIFQEYPTLNFVFWSLEIELQFYLLAPFLASAFYLNAFSRRTILILVIFGLAILNLHFTFPFRSIINYLHYFLAGMLAVDLFLSCSNKLSKSYIFDTCNLVLLFIIWTGHWTEKTIILPFALCLFILLSPSSKIWSKCLEWKGITIIGGMCYSLYMLHHPIMALFVNRFQTDILFLNSVPLDFLIRLLITLVLVLICCALFFIFIERPTMKRNWYRKDSLRQLFKN